MMRPGLDNDTVLEVQQFHEKIRSIGYHRKKKDAFLLGASELSSDGRWLLTFACWHSLFNSRFTAIDASLYYALPKTEHTRAVFSDFLRLLHAYDRTRVTTRREAQLSRFLLKCAPVTRRFYLELLAKTFTKGLPLTEVQTTLPMDTITLETVYAPLPELTTSFTELTYPILLQPLHAATHREQLRFVLLTKTPAGLGVPKGLNPRLAVREDLKRLPAPQCVLPAFADPAGRTYTVDAFAGIPGHRCYRLAEEPRDAVAEREDFIERAEFLATTRQAITTQLSCAPVALVETEAELGEQLGLLMLQSASTSLLVTDKDTARTKNAYVTTCRITQGIIDGVWAEGATPRGLYVWVNGLRHSCPFGFAGKDNAVLGTPDLVRGKVAEEYYFLLGQTMHVAMKQILWEAKPWTGAPRQVDSTIWVEKCALCGGTHRPKQNRGLCQSCVWNMPYHFKRHGVGTWIRPAKQLTRRRQAGCWHPHLLNRNRYRHAGRYYLEARDDGAWRFVDDDHDGQLG